MIALLDGTKSDTRERTRMINKRKEKIANLKASLPDPQKEKRKHDINIRE